MVNDIGERVRKCMEDIQHPDKNNWHGKTYCACSIGEGDPTNHNCSFLVRVEVDLGNASGNKNVAFKGYGCNACLPSPYKF